MQVRLGLGISWAEHRAPWAGRLGTLKVRDFKGENRIGDHWDPGGYMLKKWRGIVTVVTCYISGNCSFYKETRECCLTLQVNLHQKWKVFTKKSVSFATDIALSACMHAMNIICHGPEQNCQVTTIGVVGVTSVSGASLMRRARWHCYCCYDIFVFAEFAGVFAWERLATRSSVQLTAKPATGHAGQTVSHIATLAISSNTSSLGFPAPTNRVWCDLDFCEWLFFLREFCPQTGLHVRGSDSQKE